jgi:hypothetical protein
MTRLGSRKEVGSSPSRKAVLVGADEISFGDSVLYGARNTGIIYDMAELSDSTGHEHALS